MGGLIFLTPQVSEESYLNSSEGLVHATEKSSECVYTWQVGDRATWQGLFCQQSSPSANGQKRLLLARHFLLSSTFCSSHSFATLGLSWDQSFAFVLGWQKTSFGFSPKEVFGQPNRSFERILIDNIIEDYLLWWDWIFLYWYFSVTLSWR